MANCCSSQFNQTSLNRFQKQILEYLKVSQKLAKCSPCWQNCYKNFYKNMLLEQYLFVIATNSNNGFINQTFGIKWMQILIDYDYIQIINLNMNEQAKKILQGVEKLNTSYYKFVNPFIVNINQCIGRGSFGQVFKGADTRTNELVAVKQISSKTLQKDPEKLFAALKNEIDIMKKTKHQNIVGLYEVLKSSNNIYLFLQLCNKGSLEDLIKKQSKVCEKDVIEIARQITAGYKFLFSKGIMHRDLKPANILIKDDLFKIADFGFAKMYEGNQPEQRIHETLVGSPIYMCPQILNGQNYSTKCDVWSLGIILFELLYGKPPFIVKNLNQLIKAVNRKQIKFPYSLLDKRLESMIRQMLIYDETKRISWKELFQHQLFYIKRQSLENTLHNSLQMADKMCKNSLHKSQTVNKMYFDHNKVIEKIELQPQQEKEIQMIIQAEEKNIIKKEEPQDLFKSIEQNYLTQEQRKLIIRTIGKYFLTKRNKAVFLNHFSLNLYDCYQTKKIEIPLEQAEIMLFVLSKYQCGIIYRSYTRLKQEKLLNCKKFTQEQFKLFMQSPLKGKLFQNFSNDFKVMKMFLDELIPKVKDYLKSTKEKRNLNQRQERINKICNNNLVPKQTFRKIYSENISIFRQYIRKQKNRSRQVLELGYFAHKAERIHDFSSEKWQYKILYEQAQRLSEQQLLKLL